MAYMSFEAPVVLMDQNVGHNVHVLLVDHDGNHQTSTKEMLEYSSYKVTTIRLASVALSIILKGRQQFDLLLENINCPDSCGFKLMQEAVRMDLPVILFSNEDDPMTTMRALQEGALFCIQMPITMDIVEYLWQHVMREKRYKLKEKEKFKQMIAYRRLQNGQGEENSDEGEKYKSKKWNRMTEFLDHDEELQDDDVVSSKRKVWIEWTQELHDKFMEAVRQLGEGRCYPKEILELMNVPGLTRMHVASHLQKCRAGAWQSPNERKSKVSNSDHGTFSYDKSRRFGFMPHLRNGDSGLSLTIQGYNKMTRDEYHHIDSTTGNNVSEDGYSSSEAYCPQLFTGQTRDVDYVYNLFGHNDNFGTSNMGLDLGLTLALDNIVMSNEQIIFDAQSIAPSTNTSPNKINTTENASNELHNIGYMIHISSIVQHSEIAANYNGNQLQALNFNPFYSSQVSHLHNAINNQWSHDIAWKSGNDE